MSYRNASTILPENLIKEIQNHVQGEQIYIPRRYGEKLAWGSKNGTRAYVVQRNREIRAKRAEGAELAQLADHYNLSEDAIRKIIYCHRRRESD